MHTTAAYTPLECLLLFQSLIAYGTEENDFGRISELLQESPLVRDGPTFDAKRLEAGALRELYLGLLCEELRAEDHDGQGDGSPPASRKRKLPTPLPPSVKDAQELEHTLPLLVDRLYARYREHMVKAIQEDERRYSTLQLEIGEIERGVWDDRIEEEYLAMDQVSNAVAPYLKTNGDREDTEVKEMRPSHPINEVPKDLAAPSELSPSPISSHHIQIKPKGLANGHVLNGHEPQVSPLTKPEASRNGPQTASQVKAGSSAPRRPSPIHAGPQHFGDWKWEPQYASSTQASPYSPGYSHFQSPKYSPQHYNVQSRGSLTSSPGLPPPHATLPSPVHPPHGVLLPPPTGMPSPGMPLDALADAAGQQLHATSGSSMASQHAHYQANTPSTFPPPYPSKYRPSSSASGPLQWNQQQFITLQPHLHHHPHQRQPFAPPPPLIQPENKQYSSPYNKSQSSKPHGPDYIPPTSQGLNFAPRVQATTTPGTPVSHGSRHSVTGCGTNWTPWPVGSTPRNYTPLPPPQIEPLSPILRPTKTALTVKSANKPAKSESSQLEKSPQGEFDQTGASKTASSLAGFHRSPSVVLHEFGEDNTPKDDHIATRNVKQEVATPGEIEDVRNTTADESSSHLPKPSQTGPSPRRTTKRKRDPDKYAESQSPSTVLWTRAFPKISAQALQDISTDKNASMFANPVKERDAPGYSNIILRPQDLKSIRSAITAGHRAATAAAPIDMNPNATSAWLSMTEDLIPPKGIINYAQLEKELMRMFANAIMFNADPNRGIGPKWQDAVKKSKQEAIGYTFDEDSVVKGTRDMYATVEKKVSDLRSVERRSEEATDGSIAKGNADEVEDENELVGDGEGYNSGGVAKKRRIIHVDTSQVQ